MNTTTPAPDSGCVPAPASATDFPAGTCSVPGAGTRCAYAGRDGADACRAECIYRSTDWLDRLQVPGQESGQVNLLLLVLLVILVCMYLGVR